MSLLLSSLSSLSPSSIATTLKILQLLLPFTNLASQIVYSNVNSYVTSYFTYKPYVVSNKQDYEKELDKLQMPQLLKWMNTFFKIEHVENDKQLNTKDSKNGENGENEENEENRENEKEITKKQYFKELYSVYKTIVSDYKQYERWNLHNRSLYVLKSYRSYSTNELAKKIIYDVHLFNEGVNLFCKLR